MKSLLRIAGGDAPQVVCIGAHCDDIEIGCGATLAALARLRPRARFHCWVFSGDATRVAETRACLEELLGPQRFSLQLAQFRDGYFPAHWGAVKERLAELSRSVDPDLVFTHASADRHQDHRLLSELTWNHFRRHFILEYEIVKFEGDLGQPNFYVPLAAADVETKVGALMRAFASQADKPWFTRSTFEAIARLRGVEASAASGYAEAFHARKTVLDLGAAD